MKKLATIIITAAIIFGFSANAHALKYTQEKYAEVEEQIFGPKPTINTVRQKLADYYKSKNVSDDDIVLPKNNDITSDNEIWWDKIGKLYWTAGYQYVHEVNIDKCKCGHSGAHKHVAIFQNDEIAAICSESERADYAEYRDMMGSDTANFMYRNKKKPCAYKNPEKVMNQKQYDKWWMKFSKALSE